MFKSFFKEFKEFAVKGNVMDLAIGVIIGAAFGKITTSLVNDIINPILGVIIGKIDFANLFISLSTKHFDSLADARASGIPVITYGIFLNTILDFLIVAIVMFFVVKEMNRLRKKEAVSPTTTSPTTKKCDFCFTEIPVKATRCPNCTSTFS